MSDVLLMGQALGLGEYAECVTVKAGQPLGSSEPDEPFGINYDMADSRSNTVACGENGRGEALAPDHSGRSEQQTNPCEEHSFTPTETHS